MDLLNSHYAELLEVGLMLVKQALLEKEYEWAYAQVELLHNLPSLIGESNLQRHRYFWFSERPHYLDWLRASGGEKAKLKTSIYYESIWAEMEPIVLELLQPAPSASSPG